MSKQDDEIKRLADSWKEANDAIPAHYKATGYIRALKIEGDGETYIILKPLEQSGGPVEVYQPYTWGRDEHPTVQAAMIDIGEKAKRQPPPESLPLVDPKSPNVN
ncbi:MAG: hypothetical protein OXQ90_05330 [Gammaproteobacteria bacterium]|nr:hypothetical protein [Gammaproteobacteria bacterium]